MVNFGLNSLLTILDLGLRGAHFVANSLYRGQKESHQQEVAPTQPVQLPPVHQQPQSNPVDSLFYHCGVLTLTVLAAVGLASVYKQLRQ